MQNFLLTEAKGKITTLFLLSEKEPYLNPYVIDSTTKYKEYDENECQEIFSDSIHKTESVPIEEFLVVKKSSSSKREFALPKQYNKENSTKICIVVTMYNESREMLERSLNGIFDNLKHFPNEKNVEIIVSVIIDGIFSVNKSVIELFKELHFMHQKENQPGNVSQMGNSKRFAENKTEKSIEEVIFDIKEDARMTFYLKEIFSYFDSLAENKSKNETKQHSSKAVYIMDAIYYVQPVIKESKESFKKFWAQYENKEIEGKLYLKEWYSLCERKLKEPLERLRNQYFDPQKNSSLFTLNISQQTNDELSQIINSTFSQAVSFHKYNKIEESLQSLGKLSNDEYTKKVCDRILHEIIEFYEDYENPIENAVEKLLEPTLTPSGWKQKCQAWFPENLMNKLEVGGGNGNDLKDSKENINLMKKISQIKQLIETSSPWHKIVHKLLSKLKNFIAEAEYLKEISESNVLKIQISKSIKEKVLDLEHNLFDYFENYHKLKGSKYKRWKEELHLRLLDLEKSSAKGDFKIEELSKILAEIRKKGEFLPRWDYYLSEIFAPTIRLLTQEGANIAANKKIKNNKIRLVQQMINLIDSTIESLVEFWEGDKNCLNEINENFNKICSLSQSYDDLRSLASELKQKGSFYTDLNNLRRNNLFYYYGCFDREEMFKESKGKWREKYFANISEFGMHRPESEFLKFIIRDEYLKINIPKKSALIYTRDLSEEFFKGVKEKLGIKAKVQSGPPKSLKVNFAIKLRNKGKLNSHVWFFNGFCKFIKPKYICLVDCGTQPNERGVYNFFRAMEADPNVGGVCGTMGVRVEYERTKDFLSKIKITGQDRIEKIFNFLSYYIFENCLFGCVQRAQVFEYVFSHILDKSFESLFGFIHVLPGAWSAYRWDALSDQELLDKYYLKTALVENYEYKSIVERNMILAEDRLLCLALFTKYDKAYTLKYVPDAHASTDAVEDLLALFNQRRRWINGSWYALDHVLSFQTEIERSKHGLLRKIFFHLSLTYAHFNMYLTYFNLSINIICAFISFDVQFGNINLFEGDEVSLGGLFFSIYLYIIILVIFLAIQNKSSDLNSNSFTRAYLRFSSHCLGIITLGTFICLIYNEFDLLKKEDFQLKNSSLLTILLMINTICFAFLILLNFFCWKDMAKSFLSYIYYIPTYANSFLIFSFCNIDDFSWGTKGSFDSGNLQEKQLRDYKISYVATWTFLNALVCYIVISLAKSSTNRSTFIEGLGLFFTANLGLKSILATVSLLLSKYKSLREFLRRSKLKKK